MDVLLNIPSTKVTSAADFELVVTAIQSGWMTLQLGTTTQKNEFRISYLCDPLNDLLESSVALLSGQPVTTSDYKNWVNCVECRFELESEGILTWVLRKIENKLYIYLWHNTIDYDDVINLYHSDFDSTKYKENLGYDFTAFPKVNEGVVFAIACEPKVWAQILVTTLEQLQKKFNPKDYQEEWGVTFNQENFKTLQHYS